MVAECPPGRAGCTPINFALSSVRLKNNKRHDETRREYAMNQIAQRARPYRPALMVCASLCLAACASQSVVETYTSNATANEIPLDSALRQSDHVTQQCSARSTARLSRRRADPVKLAEAGNTYRASRSNTVVD
jgi:hypothetical protein